MMRCLSLRINLIHLFSLLIFGGCAHPNAEAKPASPASSYITCEEEANTNITSKKTLLKTFTHDYWKVASEETAKLPVGLRKRGIVVGDFHFNNLGVYYDTSKNKSSLVINDFDDAGENYLIIDLFKFISYVKKVDSHLDLKDIVDNYYQGLQGKSRHVPDRLLEILNRTKEESQLALSKYLRKRAEDFEKFNLNDLTEAQRQRANDLAEQNEVKSLRDPVYMTEINSSGSSIGMERYLFMNRQGKGTRVIEFKQLKCSATGTAGRQDLIANFSKIKSFYQKNLPSAYWASQRIHQQGSEFYLVREKQNNPLKKLRIPIMSTDRVQNYSNFFANYLGQIHSFSANSNYIRAVNENKVLILEKAEEISDLFKEIMLEEVDDESEN